MTRPVQFALGFAISLAILALRAAAPCPVMAQYMYLDTNGDSVHTDSDTIIPSGATLVDVWLRTNANRDGSPASCLAPGEPLDLQASFILVLQSTGGTVNWGTFTNRRSPVPTCNGRLSNSTDFYCGLCGTDGLPPGLYHLASVSVSVAGGTPSLHIRPSSGLWAGARTAFGSSCSGSGFDNTITLGKDWFDVDGARYGGWINAPTLQQPSSMTVAEGSTTIQDLAATDPDGSVMTFTKASGPTYLTVETLSSAGGVAAGTITLRPNYFQSGSAIGEVQVSDGVGSDFRSFGIQVSSSNRPPELDSIPDVCLEQGQRDFIGLSAPDPDGNIPTFASVGLPSFAVLIDPGYGFAYIDITVPPNEGPALHAITIIATDGEAADSQSVTLRTGLIGDCSGRKPIQATVYPNPATANATLSFWTSRPGRLRVTLHDIRGRRISTLLDESNAASANYRVPIMGGYRGSGGYLASGVYFYRIEGVDGVSSGRVLILRRSSEFGY